MDPAEAIPPEPAAAPHTRLGWGGDDAPVVPQCWLCLHMDRGPWARGVACRAFMGGVPQEIQRNQFDHRRPHPFDGGEALFERDPDTDLAAYLRLETYWHNRGLPMIED